MVSQLATTLPLPSVTNEALRRGVYRDESLQDALVEVEVLTAGEGVVPFAVSLYDFCREIREFADTPDADLCPILILPTEEGRAATETGLDEDKSVPSTLSFAVAETATSTKVCQVEEGKR